MPPEIAALIDKPGLLLIILLIGAAIGIAVERFVEGLDKAKRRAYWAGRKSGAGKSAGKLRLVKSPETTKVEFAADQLAVVMRADFKSRALLNKPERRLLTVLDQVLSEESPGWRAMGQVSLGEILWCDDKDAFWAINAKRVDLLIVDTNCHPLHAIEFQGGGHHLGSETAARDAVKKEALRRAGIGYVEVVSGDTPAEVRALVRKMVRAQ